MANCRSIAINGTGAAVEYVRSRRMLRLAGGTGGEVVELAPSSFLRRLGIDVNDLVPTRNFLIFAGSHDRPVGGLGDIDGVFAEEAEARERFRQLRLLSPSAGRWGQLVALAADGGVRPLCWFGRQEHGQPAVPSSQPGARPWIRRLRRRSFVTQEGL